MKKLNEEQEKRLHEFQHKLLGALDDAAEKVKAELLPELRAFFADVGDAATIEGPKGFGVEGELEMAMLAGQLAISQAILTRLPPPVMLGIIEASRSLAEHIHVDTHDEARVVGATQAPARA